MKQEGNSLPRHRLYAAAALVVGWCGWLLVVSAALLVLRVTWPDYAAAEPGLRLDFSMMLSRLLVSTIATLMAGAAVARLAPSVRLAPALFGAGLVIGFTPLHIAIWSLLPTWYHLTFLLSLVPLGMAGGWLVQARRSSPIRPPAGVS